VCGWKKLNIYLKNEGLKDYIKVKHFSKCLTLQNGMDNKNIPKISCIC
jgi:hypothetical protein